LRFLVLSTNLFHYLKSFHAINIDHFTVNSYNHLQVLHTLPTRRSSDLSRMRAGPHSSASSGVAGRCTDFIAWAKVGHCRCSSIRSLAHSGRGGMVSTTWRTSLVRALELSPWVSG